MYRQSSNKTNQLENNLSNILGDVAILPQRGTRVDLPSTLSLYCIKTYVKMLFFDVKLTLTISPQHHNWTNTIEEAYYLSE